MHSCSFGVLKESGRKSASSCVDFADEDVAGGAGAAFGIGVEHGSS
jgi:hypothetical protein